MGKSPPTPRQHPPSASSSAYDNDRNKYSPKPHLRALTFHQMMFFFWLFLLLTMTVNEMRHTHVSIKTPLEQHLMRSSGRLAAQVLEHLSPLVVPGVSTASLDAAAFDYMVGVLRVEPAPLNYGGVVGGLLSRSEVAKGVCRFSNRVVHSVANAVTLGRGVFFGIPLCGFPKSVCISVNDVVCHGIPSSAVVLQFGDLVNIDVTVIYKGYHGDTSRLWIVGQVPGSDGSEVDETLTSSSLGLTPAHRLYLASRECLFLGVASLIPGKSTLGDLGFAIQSHAESLGYSVVRPYVGHGTGSTFHEGPRVEHFGKRGEGGVLYPGMVLTIEPMINEGDMDVVMQEDQWEVRTRDGKLSAQWEHTVLVTEDSFDILTLRKGETWPAGVEDPRPMESRMKYDVGRAQALLKEI